MPPERETYIKPHIPQLPRLQEAPQLPPVMKYHQYTLQYRSIKVTYNILPTNLLPSLVL